MSALIDDYQRTQYVRTSLPIADTAALLRSFKYNLNVGSETRPNQIKMSLFNRYQYPLRGKVHEDLKVIKGGEDFLRRLLFPCGDTLLPVMTLLPS